MRDYRDAKAMALTLREQLHTKSVSLKHSECLEIVAKMLGFNAWNVLATKLQSEGGYANSELGGLAQAEKSAPLVEDSPAKSGERAGPPIIVDAVILDLYVGFYRLSRTAVMTVTREQDHLSTRLTGQLDVAIYAESDTEFSNRDVGCKITFVTDAAGHAQSLVLLQRGVTFTMQRIDGITAKDIALKTAEKVKSQSASPGTDAALSRLIDGLISGKPNYEEMSSGLADATRQQLPGLHRGFVDLGVVQSTKFLGVSTQGEDVYSVQHANGASHWRIVLDDDGKISSAWVGPGP